MIGEALLLGLSSGTFCIMYCAPIAIPFFFSEEMDRKANIVNASLFIFGRLIGYCLFGAFLGVVGAYALGYLDPVIRRRVESIGNILVGVIMLASGIYFNFPKVKICNVFRRIIGPGHSAILYGILTGLNLCPPFFAAAAGAFSSGSSFGGAIYFIFFFFGTTIYFIPLFGIHLLNKRIVNFRMVSRLILILMGGYLLFFRGIINLG